MSRIALFFAAVAAVLAIGQLAVSNQLALPPATEPAEESLLTVGQTVGLEENADRYTITVNPTWRTRNIFNVVGAQDDFVVLEDQARKTQMRIPVWSIRAVIVQATGVESRP